MRIIILGAGQVGRTAAYHLSREEANDVTVVDANEDILRDLQDRLDIRTVSGNAASPRILEAAGIAGTDILVALTNSDEVNMLACHIAWTLYRTPKKIARVRSAAFTEREALFGENAVAVDVWISPEQLVTEYVTVSYGIPARCRCSTSRTDGCGWSASARCKEARCGTGAAHAARAYSGRRRARRRDLSRRQEHPARGRHRHRGRRRGFWRRARTSGWS